MNTDMKEIGSISVHRGPLSERERLHITDAIADIRRPYEQLILKHCATRIPRTILHKDGTVENEWDHATQSFIDTTNRHMVDAVRQYLRGKGL